MSKGSTMTKITDEMIADMPRSKRIIALIFVEEFLERVKGEDFTQLVNAAEELVSRVWDDGWRAGDGESCE